VGKTKTSGAIVRRIVVVPIVPSASVAEIVTVVCERAAVGKPVKLPVDAFSASPYAVKSIEAEYTIGNAATPITEVAVNRIGLARVRDTIRFSVLPFAGVLPPKVTTSGLMAIVCAMDRVRPFVLVAVNMYDPTKFTTVGVPARRYVVVVTCTNDSPGGSSSTVRLASVAEEKKLPVVITKSVGPSNLDWYSRVGAEIVTSTVSPNEKSINAVPVVCFPV